MVPPFSYLGKGDVNSASMMSSGGSVDLSDDIRPSRPVPSRTAPNILSWIHIDKKRLFRVLLRSHIRLLSCSPSHPLSVYLYLCFFQFFRVCSSPSFQSCYFEYVTVPSCIALRMYAVLWLPSVQLRPTAKIKNASSLSANQPTSYTSSCLAGCDMISNK